MDREAVVQRTEPAQAGRRAQPLRGGHQHHRQDARLLRRGQPHPLLRLRRRSPFYSDPCYTGRRQGRVRSIYHFCSLYVAATTHDYNVFSFHPDNSPCHGFEEVLACYRNVVPHLRLSGPTSFAPIVEAAVDIVDRAGGQYHVLVIVADGQVTRSVDTGEGDLSPQERRTVDSIVMASSYPLSIVLVGVGDGPWEDMQKFDDKLPARAFDNFQFVNFTSIMSRNATLQQKESAFALAALMEVPIQYKATMELGILGRSTGKAKRVVPAPPPLPASSSFRQPSSLRREASGANAAAAEPREDQVRRTARNYQVLFLL
uniref:Copine C-terminal domain-containing protein n=1 Tax=Hordeum vulgare subsp. vulgare TaxID=112509 RepID=A0A8I6YPK3_HORVV